MESAIEIKGKREINVILHMHKRWLQFSQSDQKNTQQNETYFPKADIDNICGYNRNI